jgi:hypothetical protein
MCSYEGEILFKQCMRDKHKKFGIKYVKSSVDSWYIYHCLSDLGKTFSDDKDI